MKRRFTHDDEEAEARLPAMSSSRILRIGFLPPPEPLETDADRAQRMTASNSSRSVAKLIEPSSRAWSVMPYLAIALLSIVAYANTLHFPFVYDDCDIVRSPLLHDPWNLRAVWNSEFYGMQKAEYLLYRPLADWGYLLNYRANELVFGDGASAIGFHAVDILLHAAVGCLIFAWLRRLKLDAPVCLIAALLFSLHPLHTETVANTTNRSDAQASLFGLAFLILHGLRIPIVPAALYLCAMWSKESAAAFLPLAIAMDAMFRGRAESSSSLEIPDATRRRWPLREYALLAGTLAVWLMLRSRALEGLRSPPAPIDNPLQVATTAERLWTAAAVQLRYLWLLVCPVGLSSDLSYDQIPIVRSFANVAVLGFFAIFLCAAAVAWRLRRRAPAAAFAILGYAILFSTTSNFALAIGTVMAERLAYTPSILFCTLLGLALWQMRLFVGTRTVAAIVGTVCCCFLWLTIRRNETWSDNLTFFREQARTSPRSAKAHVNFGSALGNIGDDRGVVVEYELALAILPGYPGIDYQLGNALRRLNAEPQRIIDAYHRAILVDTTDVDARANLAWTLIDLGRKDEARAVVREMRALAPDHLLLPKLEGRLAAPGAPGAPTLE